MNGIYRLIPFAVPKPWGGGHLDALAQNAAPEKIGEYVLFSNLPQFPVKVVTAAGEKLLADFLCETALPTDPLPFMLKLLSTSDSISVQNHPSDADTQAMGLKGGGKFECWTILDADPGARAYLGLKQGENPQVLHALEAEKNPLSHFNAVQPQQGDVIKLNPGLVHSTTGRLLFYEIQQTSDHTFRIYDFGRGRELHLGQAIRCMKDQTPDILPGFQNLVTDKFSVKYHRPGKELRFAVSGKKFSVLTWMGSAARLNTGKDEFTLVWGDSLLVTDQSDLLLTVAAPAAIEPAQANLPMIDVLFEAYC